MPTKAQTKLRKHPHHSERLYALIRVEEGKTVMCYRFAPSVRSLYAAIVEEETLGTGHTVRSLQADGWVARPVLMEER